MSGFYDKLGLSAVIFTSLASILSLLVYLVYGVTEYLYYSLVWFIIAFIDYILWRTGPRSRAVVERSYCSELRESVETLAMLSHLSKHRGEYGVDMRLNSLLSKRDSYLNTIISYCGEKLFRIYVDALENVEDEEKIGEAIKGLHECMVSLGCESNVLVEE